MRLIKLLLIALLFTPSLSMADGKAGLLKYTQYRNTASTNTYNLIEDVGFDGAASTRTVTLDTAGYSKLRVFVFITADGPGTNFTITPTCSLDGTNYASVVTRSCTSGLCLLNEMTDQDPDDITASLILEYDVSYCSNFKVVGSATGGDASDLISIQAVASVGN